jgi:hypothetical protein
MSCSLCGSVRHDQSECPRYPNKRVGLQVPLLKQPVKSPPLKQSIKSPSFKQSPSKLSLPKPSVKSSLSLTSTKLTKTGPLPRLVKSSVKSAPSLEPLPKAPTGVNDSEVNPIILRLIDDVEKAQLTDKRLEILKAAIDGAEDLSEQQSALIYDVIHNLAVRYSIKPDKLWGVVDGPDLAVIATIGHDRLVDAYLRDLIESHVWGGWMEAEAAANALAFHCDVYAQQPVGNPTFIVRLHRDAPLPPRTGLALLYDGAHYRAYHPDTHAITENGGGGDCLYEALADIAGNRPRHPVRVLRSMTVTELSQRRPQVFDAIVLLQFENNPEHAIGPRMRALLADTWENAPVVKSQKSDKREPMTAVPGKRFQIKGLAGNKSGTTNVLAPYRTKRSGVSTKLCKVIIAGGRSLDLYLTAEERKLFRKNAHFYVVPDTLIHYGRDDDATWADLVKAKTENAPRYGIELQLNKSSIPVLPVGVALDAAENGHKPIWGSRLRVREGGEPWRDAFHISLDSLGFGVVLEIVVTHISGGNLQSFFERIGPAIADALKQFGGVNTYLYRTGNLSDASYLAIEGGFKAAPFARSYTRNDAQIIGQVTTTLTVKEIQALKVHDLPPFQGVEQVYVTMQKQAAMFRKSHSKNPGALIKNAVEQFTTPNYLPGDTIIHKNPVTVKKKPVYLTFGGNKVGYRFQRGNKTPAFLIEFREGTKIGPGLTDLLAHAIRGKQSTTARERLEQLGLPVVTAGKLEFQTPKDYYT